MVARDGDIDEGPLHHRHVAHYHGDTVRTLFVVSAVILLVAETTGASLPLTMTGIVALAVALVVAAGITNPAQAWIHFLNAIVSIYGAVTFGMYAIEQYHRSHNFTDTTYLFAETLALLFLVAVYFTTKTVRGVLLRPHFL